MKNLDTCAISLVTPDTLTLVDVRRVRTAMLQAQAVLLNLHKDARARLRSTQQIAEVLIGSWATTDRHEDYRRTICDVVNSAACVPQRTAVVPHH